MPAKKSIAAVATDNSRHSYKCGEKMIESRSHGSCQDYRQAAFRSSAVAAATTQVLMPSVCSTEAEMDRVAFRKGMADFATTKIVSVADYVGCPYRLMLIEHETVWTRFGEE